MIIRYIIADIVALVMGTAMFFVIEKAEAEKWHYHVFVFFEMGIVAIGSGLMQLLVGRSPVTEIIVPFFHLCTQHLRVVFDVISLYFVGWLAVSLTLRLLFRFCPRFTRWADRESLAKTEQEPSRLASH